MKTLCLLLAAFSAYALEGNQILHSFPTNKPYQRDPAFVAFVQTEMKGAVPLESDAEVLHFASDEVTVEGLYVELGTGLGRTTNFIAALNPRKTLYTFDSYLGLTHPWDKGTYTLPKGHFAWPEGQPLPNFHLNVKLVKGLFAHTLPTFVQLTDLPIALLHIDCEIYESSAEALDILGPKIVDGTIILFDEYYNYPNYRNHEYKAFQEFLQKFDCEAEYIAYNPFHEQVAVRIHKKWDGR